MLRRCTRLLLCLAVSFAALGYAQTQTQAPNQDQPAASEVAFHDTPATFRTKVNLVLVPVIVRDKDGHAVGNLHKEDFQVFDRGKAQAISSFNVETIEGQKAETAKAPVAAALPGAEEPPPPNPANMPNR
ncbi:MAG: hypothetical protein ABSH50_09780 [Bryobacteraceae bacterium]